ncbi:MAG: BACON domain-containing protein [Mangrovibacterium sp.]
MKKLLIIIISCLYLVGCNDDSDNPAEFGIVRSDVNIPATGGEGTIEVLPYGNIQATSDQEWCTVSVSGYVVTVNVSANEDILNRTALVTISSGAEKLFVPVTQPSAILSLENNKLIVPRAGGTQQVKVTTNLDIHISVEDEWLTYVREDQVITFTAEPNTEPGARQTVVTITGGKFTAQIEVIQISYADLLGDWNLSFVDDEGNPDATIITLTEDVEGSSYIMSGLPAGLSIKVLYNNGNLIIESGQYVGRYSTYYLYLCLWDGSTLTWNTSVQYEAPASFGDEWSYPFADNGTWTGTVQGILIAAFSGQTPSSASYAGYLLIMDQWVLTK